MSVQSLAYSIKRAVDNRIQKESRAMRGTIHGNNFICGNKSYKYVSAVDADTYSGNRVWAQLSRNNSAVIVGE